MVHLDIFEAFNCIPDDHLIAKLNGYGFDREALKTHLFLSKRKESVCTHQ